MTESTDHAVDSPAAGEVVSRTTRGGIAVRKVATLHGPEAVAVYFTLRSNRHDRCTVRIVDAIPEPLRGKEIEFHPRYDPANWSRADGTVVYDATVAPDANRTTVYGVAIDDSSQLELFSAEPAVEVESNESADSAFAGSDDGSFSFAGSDGPADSTAEAPVEPDLNTGSAASGSAGRAEQTPDDTGVLEALVSEVRRRDLTEPERRALREALGLDGFDAVRSELDTLREAVETLRDEVAAADRQAADVDRIEAQVEALSEVVDRRHASLTDDLEALEAALDREARWRSRLRDSLEYDPEAER